MNLASDYLGLSLRSPLVPSACPLTGSIDNLRRMEDAGAAAVVLPSLFEEQLRGQFNDPSWSLKHGIAPYPPGLSYLPSEKDYLANPDAHLERIRLATSALDIPVIASISAGQNGDWIPFAKEMETAGVDAIELSIYHVPTSTLESSAQLEGRYLELIKAVRRTISIPLSVKISPFFTSLPHFVRAAVGCGADGLVLFNRLFGADIRLEHRIRIRTPSLTDSKDTELPLRWLSILRHQNAASLAVSSGVHTGEDALKLIAAGADVTMVCSSLMLHGIEHLKTLETEMTTWLEARGHISLSQIRGCMSLEQWPDPSAL
jgi:dihydroorotate dehydrogenase (fumarate)